jgi:c-di-GMP-binding flagellar brake protein YcgR
VAWPEALLVTTPELAQCMEPPASGYHPCTTVIVAEDDCTLPDSPEAPLGFEYLVRRPFHPETMRLLLLRALYRGRDQRTEQRYVVGHPVLCLAGYRPGGATLLEISAGGCRLLAGRRVAPGTWLALRLPRNLTGDRALILWGCVIRCHEYRRDAAPGAAVVAVEFRSLSARTRARLAAILYELDRGPETFCETAARALRPEPLESSAPGAVEAEPDEVIDQASHRMRRHYPRAPFQQEVAALDRRAERVLEVFCASQISAGGLRVEPHPMLGVEDRLRLAIRCADAKAPLVVEAEVVGDYGAHGFGMRFIDMEPGVEKQLEQMVAAAGIAGVGRPGAPESGAMLVAEILETSRLDEITPSSRLLLAKGESEGEDLLVLESALLDLASVGCTVQRIFELIPEPATEIVRALESLLEQERIQIER